MGMIRVSDEVESRLKEVADGRSMNSVIEKMLAYCSSPDGFCPTPQEGSYTPLFLEKIFERFDELKSLIEDTTVDRVAGPIKSAAPGTVKIYVPWDTARELFFEFLPDDAPEYIGSASGQVHQADEFPVFIVDDKLWTEDYYGMKTPILNISPRVQQFLESHK